MTEPKTDELGVSFIVTEWISELPLEVSALHEVTHENWQELYAQLRLYVEKAVLKGRIDELKEIQMADDLSDATKDVLYDCYINDRLKELHNES